MRGGSLHDAMTMTPQHGQKQMSAGLDFPNSAERGQSKMARSALQMSAISSSNTSANQSALDSGASSPEESFSNGDSGDEGAQPATRVSSPYQAPSTPQQRLLLERSLLRLWCAG